MGKMYATRLTIVAIASIGALLAVLPASPSKAEAAPFCVVRSYGTDCFYYDLPSCRRAAGPDGACIVNPDEAQAPSGAAPFCVVTSYGTQCWYYDASSCRRAASSSGGACVVNPNR